MFLRLTLGKWWVTSMTNSYCILMLCRQILVHAPPAATDALIESCGSIKAMTKEIYAPPQGETVQIGQHTNSFSISLSDELLASLKMSRVSWMTLRPPFTRLMICHSSRTTKSAMFLVVCPAWRHQRSQYWSRQLLPISNRHLPHTHPSVDGCLARGLRKLCRSRP